MDELISLVLLSIGVLGPADGSINLAHYFWLTTGRGLANRSGTSRFLETTFWIPSPQFCKVTTKLDRV